MPRPYRITQRAQNDIASTLEYTRDEFGQAQCDLYRSLIKQTIREITEDPEEAPAKRRDQLRANTWIRHLGRHARHILIYRIVTDGSIEFGRLLHDAMDIERHLPEDYLR